MERAPCRRPDDERAPLLTDESVLVPSPSRRSNSAFAREEHQHPEGALQRKGPLSSVSGGTVHTDLP